MNSEEVKQTQELLSKLEPGILPEPIFYEFARLSVSGIFELVPLRNNLAGEVEVLVLNRKVDDPHWPGMLHTPGTMLRPTDSDDFSTALERVFGEINRNYRDYTINKIDTMFHTVNRGKELSIIFATEIVDTRESDIWIHINDIYTKIVSTQISFVKTAAEKFMNRN